MSGMGAELAPGQRVGRYRLLFRLGKGGMGEVWAAGRSHAELGFQKLVALKVLRTRDLESNAAVMFFDEAKAASALHHAAIVNTTDLGQDGDLLYIAMDLVRGPSLTALLQRLVITQTTMPPAVVAHIGILISSALDYAHDRALVNGQPLKLVHRDFSPHNVLIDLNGAVRLTDFGVARTAIQDHESRVGTVRGKPSYMAPEQVVGGKIDARTDLFALGIVLYESSCLKRLFGRSQPVKSMDAVMKHQPKPLPAMVPDFPETLWAVIRKALEKDPRRRFQSATQMCEALTSAANGLDGFDGASRALVHLVGKVFEPDAFDTDARVREAIEQAGPMESEEATANARSPERSCGVQVVGAEAATAWPSADASDPLAPEALEEARTAYRAIISPIGGPQMPAPAVMMHSGSMDALPVSTHQSFSGALPPQKKSSAAAIVETVAAVALAGTAAFIVAARSEPPPLPAEQPQSVTSPSVAPTVAVESKATARPVTPPPTTVRPAPAPEPEEAPAPRTPRRTRRPQPTKAAQPSAPAPADATFAEVRALIRQVRALDANKGGEMFATLTEAGRDNPEVLNRLRRDAKRYLEKQATP